MSGSDDTDGLNLINKLLLDDTDHHNKMEKLASTSSCVINAVKSGGSALISFGQLGVVFQLLEKILKSLESSNLKVPIFMISSVAEETIAFSNIIRMVMQALARKDLIKLKKLHLSPDILSEKLLQDISFSSHIKDIGNGSSSFPLGECRECSCFQD